MPTELVEKRERLSVIVDVMAAVYEAAGKGMEFQNVKTIGTEDVSKENTEAKCYRLKKLNTEADDLQKAIDTIVEGENALRKDRATKAAANTDKAGGIDHPGAGNTKERKSLQQQIQESSWYRHVKEHGMDGSGGASDPSSTVQWGLKEMKATFQTSAGWSPESVRSGLVVDAVTRPIQVTDMIPSVPTGQAAYVYMEETTRTHAAVEKAEALSFPESAFALTQRSVTVEKISDSIPTTDEQLADEPGASAYLSSRLEFGLRQRLDSQILVGNGVTPNLEGINNATGVQTQALGGDALFTAAKKAMTLVAVTGRAQPNAFIFHPNDWESFVTQTTADGLYILGNPALAPMDRLWGRRVIESDAQTENTGLVGDFATFALLAERQGVDIRTGFVNDDFVKGRVTMRGTIRVAMITLRGAAFCQITGI